MRTLLLFALLLLPLGAAAHEEVLRTELRSIPAEVVAIGRVVQVEANRGSRGPRSVSIVVERELVGSAGAAALTFHAPVEHGPGWAVGDHALFFLSRFQGRWHATALAAESPRAEGGGTAALERRWLESGAPAEAEGEVSWPGLAAGGLFFVGLLWLGYRRRRA